MIAQNPFLAPRRFALAAAAMLEPNRSFTPDQKMIVFASYMFGPTYVFGVEVAKAAGSQP